MRRPLKPFVTEYKGASRRPGSPASQPLKIDSEPAAPRPSEPRPLEGTRAVPPPQEDSYEAALRAADALFAAPPRSESALRPTPTPRIADARADDARNNDPWAGTQPHDDAPAPPATSTASPSNGGRILRVLDEPPSPELLRLEEERAPKRRGRKPGSKNKPKLAPPVSAPAVPASAGPASVVTASVVATAVPADAPTFEAPASMAASTANAAIAPGTVTALRPQPYRLAAVRPAVEPARDEKYAWVRTKLKPGERWKRRLPKVAW